jgi:hypothetical protein
MMDNVQKPSNSEVFAGFTVHAFSKCATIFYSCRMKRSGSGNLDDLPGEGEFTRGGVRATAGPRLGWTTQPVTKPR